MSKVITAREVRGLLARTGQRQSKYRNRKTTVDGLTFDSAAEAERWGELRLMEKAGEIEGLERQVRFPIEVNGEHVCFYRADFVYFDGKTKHQITEDTKGFATPEFKLKCRLMRAVYGIDILQTGAKPARTRKSNHQRRAA